MKDRRKLGLRAGTLSLIGILLISVTGCTQNNQGQQENTSEAVSQEVAADVSTETKAAVSTTYFDENRLQLLGAIEYDGPDFESGSMKDGKYTMLKIQNVSSLYLRKAEIEVKVNQDETMKIIINDLPAGETVMVMGQSEFPYEEGCIYVVTECQSNYESSVINSIEGLRVETSSAGGVLYNDTNQTMNVMTVRYKGIAGSDLFGGVTFKHQVGPLAPGESDSIENECFLAEAIEIVEITQ